MQHFLGGEHDPRFQALRRLRYQRDDDAAEYGDDRRSHHGDQTAHHRGQTGEYGNQDKPRDQEAWACDGQLRQRERRRTNVWSVACLYLNVADGRHRWPPFDIQCRPGQRSSELR